MLRRLEPNPTLKIAIILDGRKGYVIADLAKIPAHQLSGYITGRIRPTDAAKQRLAEVLGQSVNELFPTQEQAISA